MPSGMYKTHCEALFFLIYYLREGPSVEKKIPIELKSVKISARCMCQVKLRLKSHLM